MPLADRSSAGRQLSLLLERHRHARPIVVGLARVGVVVASEIARALGAPLELWITRRVCAPDAAGTTIGAVSEDGAVVLNRDLIACLQVYHIETEQAIKIGYGHNLLEKDFKIIKSWSSCGTASKGECNRAARWRT